MGNPFRRSILLVDKHGPLMPSKHGGRILFQFPVRNAACTARTFEPLVPEPPGGTAVPRVVDHKSAVAVRRDPGLFAHFFDGPDAVQHPLSGRPQLDLVDQPEQLDAFPVESLLRCFCLFAHRLFSLTQSHLPKSYHFLDATPLTTAAIMPATPNCSVSWSSLPEVAFKASGVRPSGTPGAATRVSPATCWAPIIPAAGVASRMN